MVLNPNGSSELGEAMMSVVGGLDLLYTSETYIVPETWYQQLIDYMPFGMLLFQV